MSDICEFKVCIVTSILFDDDKITSDRFNIPVINEYG
jgi:hypothetical protein